MRKNNMWQTTKDWVEDVAVQSAQLAKAISANAAAYWALVMGEVVLGAALVLNAGSQANTLVVLAFGWVFIGLAVVSVTLRALQRLKPQPVPVRIKRQ
jgi:hypothetical protein